MTKFNLTQIERADMIAAMEAADCGEEIEIEVDETEENWEELESDDGHLELYEDDGQPDEYTEWQDYYGGDDWDNGQYDCMDY